MVNINIVAAMSSVINYELNVFHLTMIIRHECTLPMILFTVRRRRAAKFQNPVKSDQPDLTISRGQPWFW